MNVRDEIGPVAAFKNIFWVTKLPKTRSGKILRNTIRKILDGEDYNTPETIEDMTALDEVTDIFEKHFKGTFDDILFDNETKEILNKRVNLD